MWPALVLVHFPSLRAPAPAHLPPEDGCTLRAACGGRPPSRTTAFVWMLVVVVVVVMMVGGALDSQRLSRDWQEARAARGRQFPSSPAVFPGSPRGGLAISLEWGGPVAWMAGRTRDGAGG